MDSAALDAVLERARRRDPQALAALVDVYSSRVFGLLFRLTGSRDVAEELLQETFLRVVRTIHEYKESGRFEAWLFRIAANLARDVARSGRRRGTMIGLDAAGANGTAGAMGVVDGAHPSPATTLIAIEGHERVNAELAKLAETDREIILLRHFSGLSFREIAETLNVPLGTALARAHRALEKLRQALAADDEG